MRTRMRRELLLSKRPPAPAPSGPATEDIVPTSTNSSNWNLFFGPTLHAVLADSSDSSYASGVVNSSTGNLGFGDLVSANGRQIASFTVTGRAQQDAASYPYSWQFTPASSGVTFSPASRSVQQADPAFTDRTTASFTKSGGGNFTEAQINAMTATFACAGSPYNNANVAKLTVTVTYA